jgi:hypothetical protein
VASLRASRTARTPDSGEGSGSTILSLSCFRRSTSLANWTQVSVRHLGSPSRIPKRPGKAWLLRLHLVNACQKSRRWMAIGDQSKPGLDVPDRVPETEIDVSLEIMNRVA